jgi:outer membrane protein assembly factor BamB
MMRAFTSFASLVQMCFARPLRRNAFMLLTASLFCSLVLVSSCGKKESASHSAKPAGPHLKWQFKSTGTGLSHPALSPDGTIYVGTSRGLQAVSPDGKFLWEATLAGVGVPVVSEGGTIYFDLRYGLMFGVSKSGQMVWRPGDGLIGFAAPPALGADTTLYFMNTTADIFAYQPSLAQPRLWDLATFREGMLRPTVLPGTARADAVASSATPLLTRSGSIILPRQNFLHSISASGSPEWELELGSETTSQAALADDGTIYVSSDQILAVDPSGSVKWRFDSGWHGSPVIDTDGVIYFTDGAAAYALNPDGSLKWRYAPPQGVRFLTSPALAADGTLYFGGEFALLAVRSDGTLKWNLRVYTPNSPPTIGRDGTIYFACGYSLLCAVEDAGSPLMRSAWPKQFHDVANTSNTLHREN